MLLHCPSCNQPLSAAHVDVENFSAKCSHCYQISFFDQEKRKSSQLTSKKQELDLPDGMSIRSMLSQLELRYAWRRHSSGFLIFFGIFWNLMLLPFVAIAVYQSEWKIFLGTSIHLLVGVGLLYYILSSLFNVTYISVTPKEVQVEHTPLPNPFRPGRTLSANQMEQVYVKKYASGKTNGQPNWMFAVEVILKNQASVRLVGGLKTADYGLFIEQEIERFLDISDRKVQEEWRGNYT